MTNSALIPLHPAAALFRPPDHRSRRRGQKVDADVNQFAGRSTANRLVLTVGKFSLIDMMDDNAYSNDPKIDFLNWSLIDTGTFDYAADAWGFC